MVGKRGSKAVKARGRVKDLRFKRDQANVKGGVRVAPPGRRGDPGSEWDKKKSQAVDHVGLGTWG